MNAFRIIVVIVIAIPALFVGIGFGLPTKVHVERSIDINASPGAVFSLVGDLAEFDKWDPWSELDPNMSVELSGPMLGVGSSRSWKGNDDVGSGVMTVVEYKPNQKAVVSLDFGEMGKGEATYLLEKIEKGTRITWQFDTENSNIIQRYFGLIMDNMLGPQYEKGLAKLKPLAEALPKVKEQEIRYTLDGQEFIGFLAYPIGEVDPVPGVVVVHEWWGHNYYARSRAKQLAEIGYAAFALDMYGDKKQADHPEDAMKFMQAVGANTPLASARFDKAVEVLAKHPRVDASQIAAIGYCFGGAVALNMARMGKNLKGVISFHGGLGDLAPLAEHAHTPLLVLNGAADPFVPDPHKIAFKKEMDASSIDYEFVDYPDVLHAFTNPAATAMGEKFELPLKYDLEADKDSWQRMKQFLAKVLL